MSQCIGGRKTSWRTILLLSSIFICFGLFIFFQVWGSIYYLRGAELQKTLKPGMSRTQVYHELDNFFPHVIETPTINSPVACSPELPSKYYIEGAQFYPPLGLGEGGILIVMCFDESGTLVHVR